MSIETVGLAIACVSVLLIFMGFFFNRLDKDIASFATRMDASTARTDKLYEMFVQLLKDKSHI